MRGQRGGSSCFSLQEDKKYQRQKKRKKLKMQKRSNFYKKRQDIGKSGLHG
jgi:hypothetical protein